MLIKIKKGEKKCYVNYLLNEKRGEYEGPYDADLTVQQLIEHKESFPTSRGTKDKEEQKEEASSSQPYRGFSKAVRGGRIPSVGLAERAFG
jgi:hypothetical protein